jgi:hypothetical protein
MIINYAAAATVEPNDRNMPKIRIENLGNWLPILMIATI